MLQATKDFMSTSSTKDFSTFEERAKPLIVNLINIESKLASLGPSQEIQDSIKEISSSVEAFIQEYRSEKEAIDLLVQSFHKKGVELPKDIRQRIRFFDQVRHCFVTFRDLHEKITENLEEALEKQKGQAALCPSTGGLLELGIEQALKAYHTEERSWLLLPLNTKLEKLANPLLLGEDEPRMDGEWKIHISIAQEDIPKAIPIVMKHLYHPATPQIEAKICTEGLMKGKHQVGKQIGILFSKETEENPKGQKRIFDFLKNLWQDLKKHKIRKESGLVLTGKTEKDILNSPHDSQLCEKENIEDRKFSACFKQVEGKEYFHYRNIACLPMDNQSYQEMRADPRAIPFQKFDRLPANQKHNPLKKDDFLKDLSFS